jgi:hypothetical protein
MRKESWITERKKERERKDGLLKGKKESERGNGKEAWP